MCVSHTIMKLANRVCFKNTTNLHSSLGCFQQESAATQRSNVIGFATRRFRSRVHFSVYFATEYILWRIEWGSVLTKCYP